MPTPPGTARKLSDLYDLFSDASSTPPKNTDIRDLIATVSLRQPKVVNAGMSPYQALETDGLLLVDASGGNVEIDLASITGAMAKLDCIVKKTDSSGNSVTIKTIDGSQIDGGSQVVLNAQNAASRLIADTQNWWTW